MAVAQHVTVAAAQLVIRDVGTPALTPARETARVLVIRDARATALIRVLVSALRDATQRVIPSILLACRRFSYFESITHP